MDSGPFLSGYQLKINGIDETGQEGAMAFMSRRGQRVMGKVGEE